jgi:hypothetical protein
LVKTSPNLEEQEKRLNLLWGYDFNKLNETEFSSYISNLVKKTVNESYSQSIEANKVTVSGYSNCNNTLNSKVTNYTNNVKSILSKLLISNIDAKVEILINQFINEKIYPLRNTFTSSLTQSKNTYNTKRESSSRQDPNYTSQSYQEPYTTYSYTHRGHVESYCDRCNGLWAALGCAQTGAHTGSWTTHRKRFLGIQVDKKSFWSCCGQKDGTFCPHSARVHGNLVRKYTDCKCAEGSNCCTTVPQTNYRTAYRQVVSGYSKVYTIGEWNDNMFSYIL